VRERERDGIGTGMRKETWETNHGDSEERRRDLSFCYMRLKDSCRNLFDLTFPQIFGQETKFTKPVLEITLSSDEGEGFVILMV